MMHESVLPDVQQALVAALRDDTEPTVQDWLHERPGGVTDTFLRVYDEGAVPADLVGRWIAVGDPGESWAPVFARSGSEASVMLHLWHTPVPGDDVGKAVMLAGWQAVSRRLSQPLALAGAHVMLTGYAALVTITRDPDGASWHGVVRYSARTQRTVTT